MMHGNPALRAILLGGTVCLLAIASAHAQPIPRYRVDPFWPQPLPNNWSMQQVVDIAIGPDDHIWAFNRHSDARPDEIGAERTPPRQLCCTLGPEILEFDPGGKVVRAWGGSDHHPAWPDRLQTLAVDRQGNVWISGTTPGDTIVKFSPDGEFLWELGRRGERKPRAEVAQNNQRTDVLEAGVGAFDFDEDANEIYIADGFVNKRILVYDMTTGEFKRGWGGKGQPLAAVDNDPTPPYDPSGLPPDQDDFAPAIHCVHISHDKLVYTCERGSDRIQVFTTQGEFLQSFWVHPETRARGEGCGGIWSASDPPCGTVYNLTFSHDPEQRHIFVADGTNNVVWILDRHTGETVGRFGGNGRYAGRLHWIDSIAVDSQGNLYTGEVEDGKRIQKFVLTN